MRVTSRDYARPRRPLPVRAFDALGRPRASLDPDDLLAAAVRAEGEAELGGLPDRLRRLCAAIEAEAALTPTGRWITRFRLVDLLRARLRLERQPVPDGDVAPPVVVTGLQRTGTTLLHRLLAADPRARAVRSWEALSPAPYPGRRAAAERAARAVRWLAPDFFAVHPVDPEATEEEVVLLALSLLSTVDEALLRVPSWSAWLEEQDQAEGYAVLDRALRALEAQEPGEWWVLKTPHHLEWLDALFGAFPAAKVVWTHRDPVTTQASFCSMVAHGRGLCSDDVDPVAIGAEWLRKCGRMVDRGMEARARLGEARFLDVAYDDLVREPERVVADVYAFLGRPYDDVARDAVRAALAVHTRERFGRHAYALEDFGLTEAAVADRFAAYRQRFL